MISTNCCWLIDGDDVLEAREAWPKYWLIVTHVPVTRTRPGCSGRPRAVLSMSCHPCGTKLPYVSCSCNESCMDIQLLNLNKINLTRFANNYLPMTVTKKIYELTILSAISCATSDVIWPCRLVRAIFHFKCLATGDGGSKLSVGLSVHECSSCPRLLFSSISFLSSSSYPPRDST